MTPTTPTTAKSCCERCWDMDVLNAGEYCMYPESCFCHTDSTKKCEWHTEEDVGCSGCGMAPQHTSFSDFFRNASPEEKERVMLEVAREATNDQRAQIGLPPLHTSPEKEPYYRVDHLHCWDQGDSPACGLKIEHEQCCICEYIYNNPPSFTEKTLTEFREKLSEGIQTRMIEQWLSSKLEEALGFDEHHWYKVGRKARETEILDLIESKKKEEPYTFDDDMRAALNIIKEEIKK